jgi:phage/plasmid-associated DNA primase
MNPANPMRKAVLLFGPGQNGKTKLLELFKAMIGAKNASAVPLQAFSEDRFARAELYGKLANTCGDLDARAVKRSDLFKMVTGGDPIVAQRKFGQPYIHALRDPDLFLQRDADLQRPDRRLVRPLDHHPAGTAHSR